MSHINRRTLVAGIAGVVPAAAVAGVPALASPDAELIALGRQLEQAIVAKFEAMCDWAPRLCEVHRKVRERLGNGHIGELIGDLGSPQRKTYDEGFAEAEKSTNLDEASDRMNAAGEQAQELSERIVELEASTIEGLRAKALVLLFEARPISADAAGEWSWPGDGAAYSLFYDVAKMTGLLPMLEHYEAKFEKVAEEIALAGGDGEIEEAAGDDDDDDDNPPAA